MKKWSTLALILIILTGFLVRFYRISQVPPALSWDEVSVGYNAYSIFKTGQDEWGQLPFANFRSYGDYPTTFYLYTLVPVVGFLGLNELSVRIPSVIFGTLLILAVYLLAQAAFKNRQKALVPALLVALSPWAILPSRQTIQVIPAVFLISVSVWLMLKNSFKLKLLGAVVLGLSAYGYHNTRILAPIFFLILLLVNWKDNLAHRLQALTLLVVAGLFFVPLVPVLLSGEGSARASWVGILDQGAINHINQSRGLSPLPGILPKLVNNKLTYLSEVTLTNYLGYFSPTFLMLEGGTHYQFSLPHFGVIYPIELPFFYLGLVGVVVVILHKLKLFRVRLMIGDERILSVLLVLTLLAPIPAAITRDPYQVVRGLSMMPFVYIFVGLGFWLLVDFLRAKARVLGMGLVVICSVALVIFSTNYLNNLFNRYPIEYSFAWQYGYKQAVEYVLTHQNGYSKIYLTKKYGEPHEFVLFYSQYDPKGYRSDPNLVRYKRSDWYWVDGFNKYVFVNDWEVKEKLTGQKDVLLITSPGNYPSEGQLIKSINFLDGSKAFDLVAL